MDANKILNGKFTLKKLPNSSIDETKVFCVFCRCELSYHHHRTSSLKYHLMMAKHTQTHTQADANSPPPRQYQDLVNISFTLLLMDSITLRVYFLQVRTLV